MFVHARRIQTHKVSFGIAKASSKGSAVFWVRVVGKLCLRCLNLTPVALELQVLLLRSSWILERLDVSPRT